MKCGCYIKWDKRNSKGNKIKKIIATYVVSPTWLGRNGRTLKEWVDDHNSFAKEKHWINIDDLRVCQGNIVVKVQAVDEAYFGGCSAAFEIGYKCDVCGCTQYEELPTDEDGISALLTKLIGEMDESYRNEAIERLKKEEERMRREHEKFQARFAPGKVKGKRKLP